MATQEQSQAKAKKRYDERARQRAYLKGDWVLVRFPADETGRNQKLSQPWHGPYRVVAIEDPDISVQKVYHTQGQMQVHQIRVTPWPDDLPPGYYWYGRKQCLQDGPPLWVERLSRQPDQPQPRRSSTIDTRLPEETSVRAGRGDPLTLLDHLVESEHGGESDYGRSRGNASKEPRSRTTVVERRSTTPLTGTPNSQCPNEDEVPV